jgi:hypothetical protein
MCSWALCSRKENACALCSSPRKTQPRWMGLELKIARGDIRNPDAVL